MRVFLFFGVSLIALALSACTDKPLNQNATALINGYHTHQMSATTAQKDSYYYLLGIGSKDEPIKAGKGYHDALQQVLAKQDELEKNISELNARHHLNYLSTTLQLHSNQNKNHRDIFCSLTSENDEAYECFALLPNLNTDITPYQILEERYWTFLNNPPAIMLDTMRVDNLLPDYKVLNHGQRIHLIHTLNKSPNQAMTDLSDELSLLRHHLANANTLIEKMILTNMVINQVQAMVFLKNQHPTISTDVIPAMTSDELSLHTAITAEFMLNYEWYNHLDANLDNGMDIKTKLFYKKHRTINQSAELYQAGITSSQLSASDFADTFHDEMTLPKQDYLNYVGSTLVNIALPDYKVYIARVKSLDNIINIANHVMNETPLHNVFAPTLTGGDIQKTHICLQNPLSQGTDNPNESNKKYECLAIIP